MDPTQLRSYARLILQTGVNLQPGQKLDIGHEAAHRDFVRVLADEAYALGAAYVNPRLNTPALTRSRVSHSRAEHLDFVPGWLSAYWDELVRDDWATVGLVGAEDPPLLEGLDPRRLGTVTGALGARRRAFSEAQSRMQFCWNICAFPTDGWARQVLGPGASADDLWKVLVPILGLDDPDPVAVWSGRIAQLAQRRSDLEALDLDRIRFSGPGTDLTVGLVPGARWLGGSEMAANGRTFAPNLPTEEVFTTPDWRRTEGTVRCTLPVEVMGVTVEGIHLTFRGGRVVDFDAASNREVLAQYLAQDGQSNALGEVALVDATSRIFQSGKVFHNTLFDENASCHIALGAGYTDAVKAWSGLNGEELLARGCNVSRVHTDFMIGGPQVTVEGMTAEGRTVTLMEGR